MTIGSSGPLLDGAASHLGHPTKGGGGYPDLTVPALQRGVGAEISGRRSGGAAHAYREPHQITLGPLGYEKARVIEQDLEPEALSGAKLFLRYINQYHRHPASGASSRTVRAG